MYTKQSYNKIKSFADQIAEEAMDNSVKIQSTSAGSSTGLMGRLERRRRERDAVVDSNEQKSQEEILAEYVKSIGLSPEEAQQRIETNQGPSTRGSVRPGSSNPVNYSEREILARTIQAEAGGEGYEGMLAVGSVMANRVGDGRYGESFKDVILTPGHFSAWNGVTGYKNGEGGLDMQNMQVSSTAYEIADKILSGNYESPVGTSTHYYNPHEATPSWGRERAGGSWQTIGNHIFGSVR